MASQKSSSPCPTSPGHAPKSVWKHIFRPRTILYFTLWAGIGVALIVALFMRTTIDVNVTPVRNPLFVQLSDGSIRNDYVMRLRNKYGEPREFIITVKADAPLLVALEGQPGMSVMVPANETKTQKVYLTAPKGTVGARDERTDVRFWIEDITDETPDGVERVFKDSVFFGKGAQ